MSVVTCVSLVVVRRSLWRDRVLLFIFQRSFRVKFLPFSGVFFCIFFPFPTVRVRPVRLASVNYTSTCRINNQRNDEYDDGEFVYIYLCVCVWVVKDVPITYDDVMERFRSIVYNEWVDGLNSSMM